MAARSADVSTPRRVYLDNICAICGLSFVQREIGPDGEEKIIKKLSNLKLKLTEERITNIKRVLNFDKQCFHQGTGICTSCYRQMEKCIKLETERVNLGETLRDKYEKTVASVSLNLPSPRRTGYETHVISHSSEGMFKNFDHQTRTVIKLYEQWKEDKFCDAVLSIGSQKVKAHKCILLANCPNIPYISLRPGTYNYQVLEVRLPSEISIDGLKIFVDYLYLGVLQLTEINVSSVEKIANYLDMKEISDFCWKFKSRLIAEQAKSCLISGGKKSTFEVVFSSDRTKMFCASREDDDDNVESTPYKNSSTTPTSKLSENCPPVNIKQEPGDDFHIKDDYLWPGKNNGRNSRIVGGEESLLTQAETRRMSSSDKSSNSTNRTCMLDMKVECKEEPQEIHTHNESHEQSASDIIQQTSCVKTLATASANVGTTVQSANSQVKKEIAMGSQQVILAAPLIGNNVVAWSPVVNSPQVFDTSTTSPQAIKPTTLLPVNMPYPVKLIPNVLNIQPHTAEGRPPFILPKLS